ISMEAIKYSAGNLQIIDQLKLPSQLDYIQIKNCEDGWNAIKFMQVRGAPAIAIVGGLSLAVEMYSKDFNSLSELKSFVSNRMKYLITSRPTAVNLFNLDATLQSFIDEHSSFTVLDLKQNDCFLPLILHRLLDKLEGLLADDINCNKLIGKNGSENLKRLSTTSVNLLTHCNTGSLATANYGTALGMFLSLHALGKLSRCFFTETRPYNQGSRLTAYELTYDKIPCTMICDSMVAALMSRERIDAVVVGADCIAANGDTANKIGTFQIAILAKHFNIPFYVAAPFTSINFGLPNGKNIVIEERSQEEMTTLNGVQLSVKGCITCWNPAFDVTPGELITGGIITEHGVFKASELKNV
ncbi:hypothetical protein HELRODRAFT_62224, partial [Helobdella robusta]|uniref:Methylthioribose-1-phosphate isomerase n=1 Tax=Helobdella robusta TaxID=6412 RepID=T1FWX3_HELRO